MSDAGILREFLVALSWKIDEAGQRRFEESVANVTKGAMALGVALEGVAVAALGMTHRVAQSLENLSYRAERTKTAAGDLKAFSYALSQVGATSEQAASMVERFAEKMRANPQGLGNYLRSFLKPGEKLAKGAVAEIEQLINSDKFRSFRYEQQRLIAEQFGLGDADLQALLRPHDQFAAEHIKRLKDWGVDMEELGERSRSFENSWRRIVDIAEVVTDKIELVMLKALDPLLKWLESHEADFIRFHNEFNEWGEKVLGVSDAFEKLAVVLTGATMGAAITKLLQLVGIASMPAWTALFSGLSALGLAGAAAAILTPSPTGGAANAEEERQQNLGKPQRAPQNPNDSWLERAKRYLGISSPASGNLARNQDEAYRAAREEGLSEKAARALVANMRGESLAKPDDYHWDRTHMSQGIVQWDPDRSAAIAKQFGKEPRFLSVADQTRAAIWEMKNNPRFRKAWQSLQGNDARAMVGALVSNYEVPADIQGETAKRLAFYRALPANLGQTKAAEPRKSWLADMRLANNLGMAAQAAEGGLGASVMFSAAPVGHSSTFNYQPSSNVVNSKPSITINGVSGAPGEIERGIFGAMRKSNAELLRNLMGAAQ